MSLAFPPPHYGQNIQIQEKAKEADKNMQRLEQREALADKAEEVTKMTVTAWSCVQASPENTILCSCCTCIFVGLSQD